MNFKSGYTSKLNAAVEGTPLADQSIDNLLTSAGSNNAVRNNGGGYYNHKLFWEIMSPNGGGEPDGALLEAINTAFGSFYDFKAKFSDAAATRFGSGWAWLVKTNSGLVVASSPNQDNPLMDVNRSGHDEQAGLGVDCRLVTAVPTLGGGKLSD